MAALASASVAALQLEENAAPALTLLDLPGALRRLLRLLLRCSAALTRCDLFPRSLDDALLRVLRDFSARDLAFCVASYRRFGAPSPAGLSLVEASARDAARAAGWPAQRVTRSWLVALRLVECDVALPCGRREGVRAADGAAAALAQMAHASPAPAVPPAPDAPCQACGLRGNSWLNLATGTVLCGRRQFDGSGGNSCALSAAAALHAARAPAPLVAKLGTLSCDLAAGLLRCDVFSYAQRDAVLFPALAAHLARCGVDASLPRAPVPDVPTVKALCAEVDARYHACVAAWFGCTPAEAPALLATLSQHSRHFLQVLFAQGSRLQHAARRAARAQQGGDKAAQPLPLLPPLAALQAQLQAAAAQLAQGEEQLLGWAAQEDAAADAPEQEEEEEQQ